MRQKISQLRTGLLELYQSLRGREVAFGDVELMIITFGSLLIVYSIRVPLVRWFWLAVALGAFLTRILRRK